MGLRYAASAGDLQSTPNSRNDGGIVRCISVSPYHSRKEPIPLITKHICMVPLHCFQHAVEMLYHLITLGMVGGCVKFLTS